MATPFLRARGVVDPPRCCRPSPRSLCAAHDMFPPEERAASWRGQYFDSRTNIIVTNAKLQVSLYGLPTNLAFGPGPSVTPECL